MIEAWFAVYLVSTFGGIEKTTQNGRGWKMDQAQCESVKTQLNDYFSASGQNFMKAICVPLQVLPEKK